MARVCLCVVLKDFGAQRYSKATAYALFGQVLCCLVAQDVLFCFHCHALLAAQLAELSILIMRLKSAAAAFEQLAADVSSRCGASLLCFV